MRNRNRFLPLKAERGNIMAYTNIGNETEQIEFKKSTGELKEGVVSIASILNKHGRAEMFIRIVESLFAVIL